MSQLQVKFGKTLWCPRSLKFFFLKPDHSIFVRLHFWLLIFLNFQTFGHGIDFCYDGSKEGRLSFDDLRLILSLRPAARATYTPEMEYQSSEGKVYIELYMGTSDSIKVVFFNCIVTHTPHLVNIISFGQYH